MSKTGKHDGSVLSRHARHVTKSDRVLYLNGCVLYPARYERRAISS